MANTVSIDLELAIKDFQQNLNKAHQQVESFHNDFKANTKGSSQAWNSFVGNLAANAVSTATNALGNLVGSIGDLGRSAIKNAGELEMMSVELGVMLGSAAAGEAQLKKLQEFAATSPFQLPGIVEANKLLLAFGSTAGEVPKTLEVLGNIAAGSGKPLSDLARIFGQVQAETKLTLERMNQLNDAGVALGPTLAQKLGIPLGDVRKAVGEGKVSFDLFRQSMISIQSEGGTYAGGMVKQSQTLQGVISSLEDNFFNLSGEIGKTFLPMVKEVALGLIEFTDTVVNNIENIKIAGQAMAVTAGLIGAYLIATNAATIATQAFALAQAVTPWGLAIAAIAAIGAGVFALIKYWDELKLATLTAIEFILEKLKPLEGVISRVFGIETDVISTALEDIGESIDNVKAKIAKKSEPIIDPEQAERDAQVAKETADKIAATKQEQLDKERAIAYERALLAQQTEDEIRLIEEEARLQKAEISTQYQDLELEAELERQLTRLQSLQTFEQEKLAIQMQAELDRAGLIKDSAEKQKKIDEISRNTQIANQKLQSKQDIDLAKKTADLKKEQYAQNLQQQESFFSAATSLSSAKNKELALIGKAAALTEIAMKTPQAVASSFAFGTRTGGPILGGVFGGIAAAAMAAQAAKVSGLNFAQGGIVPGNSYVGDNVAANVNSSEMILNKAQQTELFNLANGSGGNNSALIERLDRLERAIMSQSIVLVADDNEIARSASRGAQNGVQIGRTR